MKELSKSELWKLVKEAALTELTWASSKQQMIDALEAEVTNIDETVDIFKDICNEVFSIAETVEIDNSTVEIDNSTVEIDNAEYYSWMYQDHELSGGWRKVVAASEIETINRLIKVLNTTLTNEQQIKNHGQTVSIKMRPNQITTTGINDQRLVRIEKSNQKNNNYSNRKRTLMSTGESPGKNVGQSSVKESLLFRPSKLIPAPYWIKDAYNIENIDTIAINDRQVYPYSIVSAVDESEPVKALTLSDKILNRRKDIATLKVKPKAFTYIRGKIHNGFSPAFEWASKMYCFQIDNHNRIMLWQLHKSVEHNVSAADLIKGQKIQDVGYIEKKEFTHYLWQNMTIDLTVGGKEARKYSFKQIANDLNKVTDIAHYLHNIHENGIKIEIENLSITDELISGRLYGSELLIGKRKRIKNCVVLHPTTCCLIYLDLAQTWLGSLGNNYQSQELLKLNHITSRMRVSENQNKEKINVRNKDDIKYIKKMLTKFTEKGIYKDREKTVLLGRLVLTDGTDLTWSHIEKITAALVSNFPIDKKLATLLTPTHSSNPDEWVNVFLSLLKVYSGVELAILINGKLIKWNTGKELLHDWCKRVYRFFKEYGIDDKALACWTVGDSLARLNKATASPLINILKAPPECVHLNKQLMLKDYIN